MTTITGIQWRDDAHLTLAQAIPYIAGLYRTKTGRRADEIAVSAKQYRDVPVPDVVEGFPVVVDEHVFPWHYWARERKE